MKFNILVTGPAFDSAAGFSAQRFCRAALEAGHEISQVFFYQQAVGQGTSLTAVLSDEYDLTQHWDQLCTQHQIPLVVCVSAAERRGVINAEQQLDLGKESSNLHRVFVVAGLGSFHEACMNADRTVTFK